MAPLALLIHVMSTIRTIHVFITCMHEFFPKVLVPAGAPQADGAATASEKGLLLPRAKGASRQTTTNIGTATPSNMILTSA